MLRRVIPATLTELTVPTDTLTLAQPNPREGDVGAIAESLDVHGQFRPLVVNAPTMTVLAGNHTLRAARMLGWTKIAVTFVDVDDEEATRIMLVANRTNDLATYDNHTLTDMLTELAVTPRGLDGTGFDSDALAELAADLETPLQFKPIVCPECGHEFTN